MQAVPELVRERQDRSAVARVVHQHVRVHARNRRGAKRAGSLVRAHGPVDPVVVEEARDDRAGLVRELAVRIDDDPPRVVPRDLPRVRRDRRRTVVVLEPVDPEQPGLEPVVALRDVVARRRRLDERVDRLVRRLVREVAGRDPGRIAAHAVVDRLVQEDGVEDERARPEPGAERLGDRLGGDAPDRRDRGRRGGRAPSRTTRRRRRARRGARPAAPRRAATTRRRRRRSSR